MKYFFTSLLLITYFIGFSQEAKYKEYSYTEFFKMIEKEKDSVFKLKDALIKYNPKTDQRFRTNASPNEKKDTAYVYRNDIVVTKHLELNNIDFSWGFNNRSRELEGVLLDIHFKKSILLEDVASLYIKYCQFDAPVRYSMSNCNRKNPDSSVFRNSKYIEYSDFFDDFSYFSNCEDSSNNGNTVFTGNTFNPIQKVRGFSFRLVGSQFFVFEENTISNFDYIFYSVYKNSIVRIIDNFFDSDFIHISKTSQEGKFRWTNNRFSSPVFLELDPFSSADELDWNQFEKGFVAYNPFMNYTLQTKNRYPVQFSAEMRNRLAKQYIDSVRIYNEEAFAGETSLKSHFYSHYRSRYNTQIANKVYIDLKDFETKRLKIEHDQNPGFRSYFKWKVNQFLKLFSDYGTEPSKAIVVSVYVIFFFALIYLFFPNTWDSHGKNRLMNRFRFFTKYMNRDAGMHDVYLEGQQDELLASEDFKNYMQQSKKQIPTFFMAAAMPLYKWSISSTKLSASFLKRIDIMKGTWSDLPKSKRIWKSILLISAFTIAVLYDILIKMLNALMLSINTFTTLGFGEIPIKGLPRYLAIIQGFIGWFMLTIFSVSLISQLLN
tara:strand:- start:5613 stop:7421 length:1809 start_codon:yes stop_codon:yes gene_type:complete